MMITLRPRREDWPERLSKYLLDAMTMPFQWGMHDCVLMVCDVVAATTDIDPAEEYRGTYDGPDGALDIIAKIGGKDGMGGMMDRTFGPSVAPVYAGRGDIVLYATGLPEPWHEGVGLCVGDRFAVPVDPSGLRYHSLKKAIKAWKF